MKPSRSLTRRLIGLLILVQTAVAIAGMTAWMLFSPFVSFDDVAAETTRRLVAQSLSGTGPEMAVRPTGALQAYAAARPQLRYAALSGNFVLPGSSPDLAEMLGKLGPVLPRNGQIDSQAPPGITGLTRFASIDTPEGDVVVASAGDRFGSDDFASFLSVYLFQLLPLFGPAVLMAALVIPLAVRRSLRPVVAASRLAETIEVESLDRRIPLDTLPAEVLPLGKAFNELLSRLEEGIARQRLFSANAAHELRTPIAVLEAKVDALPPGPTRTDLKRSVTRIGVLLNQLLAVARLGQRELHVEEVLDAAALARSAVADCAPLAIRSGRAVSLRASIACAPVLSNRQALSSALVNLIDNALSFEPVGGTVLVGIDADGDDVVITVEDHGPGIAPSERLLVFEPFWRKDEARSGSGLGLSIASEIARLHGGSLGAHETEGGGATFRLLLPLDRTTITAGQVRTISA